MKSRFPEVLIIGGGVIGLTTAWYLSRAGARVTLVDKEEPGRESSWAGAGILSAAPSPQMAQNGKQKLLARSNQLFPGISQELQNHTGIDNGYRLCGGIEITDSPELEEEWSRLEMPFEKLDPDSLRRVEPGLKPFLHCYLFPSVAQVRNPRHLKAMIVACCKQGVVIRSGCPIYRLERKANRIVAALTGGDRLVADKYLIASGSWSEGLLQSLGISTGIHPVRGQIALLRGAQPPLRHIIQYGKRYLVPRPDGRVLVGSTEELVGFEKRTTSQTIQRLLAFASDLAPDLGDFEVERCWAGLRPGNRDGFPLVGPVASFENLYLASGHYRAGIQLSPATGLIMKELLLEEESSLDIADLYPR